MPVQAVAPALLNVRVFSVLPPPPIVPVPVDATVVAPVPLIVPPVHVIAPVTVSVPEPPSVPLSSSKVCALDAPFTLSVAPLTRTSPAPVKVVPSLRFSVPEMNWKEAPLAALSRPVRVPPLVKFTVPVFTRIVPPAVADAPPLLSVRFCSVSVPVPV